MRIQEMNIQADTFSAAFFKGDSDMSMGALPPSVLMGGLCEGSPPKFWLFWPVGLRFLGITKLASLLRGIEKPTRLFIMQFKCHLSGQTPWNMNKKARAMKQRLSFTATACRDLTSILQRPVCYHTAAHSPRI
jgi:hypothetical protein